MNQEKFLPIEGWVCWKVSTCLWGIRGIPFDLDDMVKPQGKEVKVLDLRCRSRRTLGRLSATYCLSIFLPQKEKGLRYSKTTPWQKLRLSRQWIKFFSAYSPRILEGTFIKLFLPWCLCERTFFWRFLWSDCFQKRNSRYKDALAIWSPPII